MQIFISKDRRAALQAVLAVAVLAFPVRSWAREEAFERTEERPRCDHYDSLKHPFFGETHLHTAYSFDAVTLDTRNTPADAYRYAKGGIVGLPPWIDTREQFDPAPPPPATSPLVAQYPYCLPPARCEFTATRTGATPRGSGTRLGRDHRSCRAARRVEHLHVRSRVALHARAKNAHRDKSAGR